MEREETTQSGSNPSPNSRHSLLSRLWNAASTAASRACARLQKLAAGIRSLLPQSRDNSESPSEDDAQEQQDPDEASPTSFGVPAWIAIGGGALVIGALSFLGGIYLSRWSAETQKGGKQETSTRSKLQQLSPGDLVRRANKALEEADGERALRLYRRAWEKRSSGERSAYVAGSRLATLLTGRDEVEKALNISKKVKEHARCGSALWRDAVTQVIILSRRTQKPTRLRRHTHLLRANLARCPEGEALRPWCLYQLAMLKFRRARTDTAEAGHPLALPGLRFGLQTPDIDPASPGQLDTGAGGDTNPELQIREESDGLYIRSYGVSLSRFLRAFPADGSISLASGKYEDKTVHAHLEGVSRREALDIVLGSLGLELEGHSDEASVITERDAPAETSDEVVQGALSALELFVMLFSDSRYLPETYYALSHLRLQGEDYTGALKQLQISLKRFPRTPWAAPAHYMAGWIHCRRENWEQALEHMRAIGDTAGGISHYATGWKGHILRHLGQHENALECFLTALDRSLPDSLHLRFLYGKAVCLEKVGAEDDTVRRAYKRVIKKGKEGKYPVLALRALARTALDRNRPEAAEKMLARAMEMADEGMVQWGKLPVGLVEAYRNAGEPLPGLLAAEALVTYLPEGERYGLRMAAVKACIQAEMPQRGLAVLSRIDPQKHSGASRARIARNRGELLRLAGNHEKALAALDEALECAEGSEMTSRVLISKARVFLARENYERCVEICRRVVEGDSTPGTDQAALDLIGRSYADRGEFSQAARFFNGEYHIPRE